MGRIKKVATERHTATASPFISQFVQQATSVPLHELPAKLGGFPQHWPFPRGDLYHWIPLLDRFDHVLELFNKDYGLVKGPQQEAFECRLLQKGDAEESMPYPSTGAQQKELETIGYSTEGDRELIESIIHFTRILLEHCGNRSLYASSSHLNDLLNAADLSLLQLCLRLCLRLAQRYQVARYKNSLPHAQAILLQNHYSLSFDRLYKIAQPFPKPPPQAAQSSNLTPGKGKDKISHAPSYNPCDLVAIAKDSAATAATSDLASVHLVYYEQSASTSRPGSAHQPTEASLASPTPARRTSNLGPSRDRPSIGERSATNDLSLMPVKSREVDSTPLSSAPKTFHIPSSRVAETPAWELVREALSKLPTDSAYEVLNRIRIAKAFTNAEASTQSLLQVRLLAVANLAYALGESKFQEKIGTADHEEPKRFHLAQQLSALLQPATSGQIALSLRTETAVLLTLEALSKVRHKSAEVSDALQISQNHGVLFYELRKVISTLNVEEHQEKGLEHQETEWRDATFDLTNTLLQSNAQSRHADRMISAGLMSILIEALSLRTHRAERFYEKVLQFFDSFIHGIPSAFQTLADVKGLDIIADLTSHEVTSALQNAKDGNGLPGQFKSKVVDYDIPFYQQSTLRQLFKFMTHMFEHSAGTHDREMRNLVDTPQVLGALRNVIENAPVFGSNVWSGGVNIMSSFIHNEPTSFQVVGEAGLVKSLLQTIVPWELKDTEDADTESKEVPTALEYKNGVLQYPTPSGILPVGETMCDIPTAFGAICLNESGMKLFQSSKALMKFMDIFVSPPHVRALEEEGQTAAQIGQAFDELSRHHPQLKEQIMHTVVEMVKRVSEVCKYLAEGKGVGAKLWERTPSGIAIAGGKEALGGQNTPPTAAVKPEDIEEDDKDRVSGVPFISACFKFLDGFFHNTGMCSYFCDQGGAIPLVDLATSASNPHDLVAFPVFSKIAQVLKTMCEAKPHLVLPSLIRRTQLAIGHLKPLIENKNPEGVFATFTDLSKPQISSLPDGSEGTAVLKSLATMHMLTHILGRALAPPQFTSSRHSNLPNQLFTILNFTDIYIELVDSLSQLHAACVWESLALQKSMSDERKQQTDPKPFMMRRVDANGVVELAAEIRTDSQPNGDASTGADKAATSESREDSLALKNAKAVRYLLSQAPMGIEAFFHSLGQALVPKRSDVATRQHAALVADRLAQSLVWELEYRKFETADEVMDSKYTVSIATGCTRTLLRNSHTMESWGAKEALTLVLNKFYLANGFSKLNECLQRFGDILAKLPQKGDALDLCAREALSTILGFYNHVVKDKCIAEAVQTQPISIRAHSQADYFMPGQFIVEIRNAVLPAVTKLWQSSALEGIGDNHAKTIIEILRTVLKADGEDRALKRSDNASRRVQTAKPEFKLESKQGLQHLQSSGYDDRLAREALYRCNNHDANATDYCRLRKLCEEAPSFPIPEGETSSEAEATTAPQASSNGAEAPASSESEEALQRQESVEMMDTTPEQPESAAAPTESSALERTETASSDPMSDDEGFRIDNLPAGIQERDLVAMVGGGRLNDVMNLVNGGSGGPSADLPAKDTQQPYTTVDDLDEKRDALREDLIDRCLEVLSAQPTITFELADLIQAAVAKSGEGANPRADIGRTLVSSLLSLQGEGPSEESGAKISAYAHLVALILQDRDFFDSTLDELKEYLDALVSWIQLGQDQKAEDAPWIEMILLIIERVLAEDEQPVEITWQPPPADDPLKALPEPSRPGLVVSTELRSSLFDAIVELLPKVGKNRSLALSVSRVLAVLTRRRDLALRLSDKHSMSRLFVMVRQLAGSIDEKLQGSFMIVLRHLIEDETILRQVMRTEIKTAFENHRSSRPMDTTSYTRNLYHLVLRDPELFVKVTGEMTEVARFDGNPNRAQSLTLKKDTPPTAEEPKQPIEDETHAQQSVEAVEGIADAPKVAEVKPLSVEVTDGVVQFLLRELSNYKDVEEKPTAPVKDQSAPNVDESTGDVDMADASTATATSMPAANGTSSASSSNGKTDKPTFKPEEHVIYIYRCFIMQCLAELLASYNRTKVEFINFSRKPETTPATPSKPRAGTLNYLLN
ncbi:E3 ubiquitin-protein ligase tom1, partial [Vermiconidia calcicola]